MLDQHLFENLSIRLKPHILTEQGQLNELNADRYPKGIALEVAAGKTPVSLELAQLNPGLLCVAQDIDPGILSWNQIKKRLSGAELPENIKFLVGKLESLQLPAISALFAIFPNNTSQTLEWLPDLITHVYQGNPEAYIQILTEDLEGKPRHGQYYKLATSLTKSLEDRSIPVIASQLIPWETPSLGSLTEYGQRLPLMLGRGLGYYKLEVNPEKASQFNLPH